MLEELTTSKSFYDVDSYDRLPLSEGVLTQPLVDFAGISEFFKQGGRIPINPQKSDNLPPLYCMPAGRKW